MHIKSVYTLEDWDRANYFVKKAFFNQSEHFLMQNLKLLIHRGRVIGSFSIIYKEGYVELNHFSIDENYRGKGLGKKAAQKIIDYCKYKKFKRINIVCEKHLVRFYQRFGFKLFKAKKGYYHLTLNLNKIVIHRKINNVYKKKINKSKF